MSDQDSNRAVTPFTGSFPPQFPQQGPAQVPQVMPTQPVQDMPQPSHSVSPLQVGLPQPGAFQAPAVPHLPLHREPEPKFTFKWIVGVALGVALIVLWWFDNFGWWIPAAALGTVIVVRIVRLDKVLRGWTPHAVCVVPLGWMIFDDGPTLTGLGIGILMLLAGLGWIVAIRQFHWQPVALLGIGLLLATACGITYGIRVSQISAYDQSLQKQQDAIDNANRLPFSPNAIMFSLLNGVSQGEYLQTCTLFTDTGKTQFAQAVLGSQATGADCGTAIHKLASMVTDPNRYEQAYIPNAAVATSGDGRQATLDGCQVDWTGIFGNVPDPGPRLGTMHLERQLQGGFLITSYQACPSTGVSGGHTTS